MLGLIAQSQKLSHIDIGKEGIVRNKLFYLLGTGISKSLSPDMHNRAFQKLGIKAHYSLLDINDSELVSTLNKIRNSSDVVGFNITAPFKERMLEHLTSVDSRTKIIGAVNTVKISKSRAMQGFNTDVDGIIYTLARLRLIGRNGGGSNTTKRAVILGAGGAARACVYAIATSGSFGSILILNRTIQKANSLAEGFKSRFSKIDFKTGLLEDNSFHQAIKEGCDILINAISNSSSNYFPVTLDFSLAKKSMRVFDLGYKEESLFLKTARKHKIKAIDGLPMLVEQAAKSFEIWTGKIAPRKVMMLAAKQTLVPSKERKSQR